jgi:hypothetical protein
MGGHFVITSKVLIVTTVKLNEPPRVDVVKFEQQLGSTLLVKITLFLCSGLSPLFMSI